MANKETERRAPGSTGKGDFYHIVIRPADEFVFFRNQDVGERGGLERIAGKREDGSWDTQAWLIAKENAHIAKNGRLVIDEADERSILEHINGPITHVEGDIFKATPRY